MQDIAGEAEMNLRDVPYITFSSYLQFTEKRVKPYWFFYVFVFMIIISDMIIIITGVIITFIMGSIVIFICLSFIKI